MNVDGHVHQSRRNLVETIRVKLSIFRRRDELVNLSLPLGSEIKDSIDTYCTDSFQSF